MLKINTITITLLMASIVGFAQTEQNRYNVLFIMSDDLNTDIGPYGNNTVKTPNLDRLAENGITFRNAYVQFPLCAPSRASLLTGLRPDSVKIYDLNTPIRKRLPDVVTLPQLFKNNGYQTVRVGKIFHYHVPRHIGTDGLDDTLSWNLRFNPRGRDWYAIDSNITPTPGYAAYNPDGVDYEIDELVQIGPRRLTLDYLADGGADAEQTDGIIAHTAVEQLERFHQSKEPFFLAVGFFRPHFPSIAPKKYFDQYGLNEVGLAPHAENDMEDIPEAALFTNPPGWGLTDQQAMEARRGYYASISFMDAQVGRVLDALERLGLAENTIVVFLSDHGYNLGEHGQWLKQSLFEKSAKAPLIISVPNGLKDTSSNRIVEYIDVFPTVVELANLQKPAKVQGKSLIPLLENPSSNWSYPAFTQVQRRVSLAADSDSGKSHVQSTWGRSGKQIMGRSIRTEQWRYTEWGEGEYGLELYNHQEDPNEFTNLASDPKHSQTITKLKKLLNENYTNR